MDSSPEEKYLHDSRYHTLVDTMEAHLQTCLFSPEEMREAVLMACIHHEVRNIMHHEVHNMSHQARINIAEAYPDYVLQALDRLIKWRKSRK